MDPLAESADVGFRLPEPGGPWPVAAAIAGLLALGRRRIAANRTAICASDHGNSASDPPDLRAKPTHPVGR
jgi:MYXO-CTERM domain-containing protein